jgi:hypothetical protein
MRSDEPEDDSGDEGDEDYAALGLVRLVRNNVSTVSAAIANQGWDTQSADETDHWNQDVMDDFHERKDAPMKFTKRKRATPNKGHGRREAFYDGRIMPIQEAKQLVIKRAPSGLGSVFTKIIEDLMQLAYAVVGLEAYNLVPLIFPFFICNGIEGILYRTYIEWPFMRTRSTPLFLTNEAFDVCEEKTFQAAFLWQRDMDDPYFTTGEWDTSSEDDENESDDDDEDDPGEVSLRKIILDSGLFPSDVVTMITNYVGDFTPFIGEVQRVIFGLPYDEHPNGIDNPVNYILPVGLHSVAMVRDNSIRVYNILSGEMMWLSHHRAAHMTDSTISNAFMLRNKSSSVTTQLVSVTDNVLGIYSAATGDQRPRRRHVQRDPCRSLHSAPAPRPASSKRRRDLRREYATVRVISGAGGREQLAPVQELDQTLLQSQGVATTWSSTSPATSPLIIHITRTHAHAPVHTHTHTTHTHTHIYSMIHIG